MHKSSERWDMGEFMLDDFTPIIHEIAGNEPVKVYPVSDLHIGSPECRIETWYDFVKRLKNEPRSYVTISGDMMDNGLKNSKTNVYGQTMRPREQKRWLVNQLEPIRDKVLCIVPGNHEARSEDDADDNPLYDVACKLDLEDVYRDNGAFIILRLGNKHGDGRHNPTYCGLVQHGNGGGGTVGSQINRLSKYGMAFEGIDFIISGHTHKPINAPDVKLVLDPRNGKVIERPFRTIIATSWLKYGGYGFRKQYAPAAYSLQEIILEGNKKQLRVLQ